MKSRVLVWSVLALGLARCTDIQSLEDNFCVGNRALFCLDGAVSDVDSGTADSGSHVDGGATDSGTDGGAIDAGRTLLVSVSPVSPLDFVAGPNGQLCDGGTCLFTGLPLLGPTTLHAYSGPFSGLAGWDAGCPALDTRCDVPPAQAAIAATFGKANRAFVSSMPFRPIGGQLVADSLCTQLAADAGLIPPGSSVNFAAYLATDGVPPGNYVSQNGKYRGWVRVDGRPVIDAFLLDAGFDGGTNRFYYPLLMEEDGGSPWDLTIVNQVWVGGINQGSLETCNNWTFTGVATPYTPNGMVGGSVNTWDATTVNTSACMNSFPVYCFEQAAAVAIELPPPPARRVFVSRPVAIVDGGGFAQLVHQCAVDAADAGFSTTFMPLAADSTHTALQHAGPGGPWYRTDGALLVTNPNTLASGNLQSHLIIDAWGKPLLDPTVRVWTGGQDLVTKAGGSYTACNDYNDTSGTTPGTVGDPNQVTSFFYVFDTQPAYCQSANAVYCVEQ